MHGVFTGSEHNQIVPEEIAFFEKVTAFEFLLNRSEYFLSVLARVDLVVVAGFEVSRENTLWIKRFIARQNLQTHIMVLHLIVAKCDIHIHRLVLPAFQQQLLVDLGRLLVVPTQIVDCGQCKLVLCAL